MKNHMCGDLFSFASVVNHGSFTRAAEELGISPSVLSKRISRLEAALKIHLLTRNTRKLSLTETGKQCYQDVLRLRSEFDRLLEAAQGSHLNPQGKLRISAPYSFGQEYLVPALFEFIERYPDINIELLFGQPSTRLIEKNIDVGIFIKEMADSSLIAKRIGKRKIMICASPRYFKQQGIPKIPEELSAHNCLLYQTKDMKSYWSLQKAGKVLNIKVGGNFSANSSQVLAAAAIEGRGIVKLPGYMVLQAIQQGKLVSILEAYCPDEKGIYAAYPFTRHPSLKVKLLIEFLAKKFRDKNY